MDNEEKTTIADVGTNEKKVSITKVDDEKQNTTNTSSSRSTRQEGGERK